MNRATDVSRVGAGLTTGFMRSGKWGLGWEMCAYAILTGETILLRAAAGGEVVGMAETAGRSWFG